MKFLEFINESINDKGIFKAIHMGGMPGAGKAQPLWSKVLTNDGWKKMGDVKVGDYVVTPKNTLSKVIQEHPQGIVDIYKVTLFDGRVVYCTKEHLWKIHGYLKRDNNKKNKRTWTIKTLERIMADYKKKQYLNRMHLPRPTKIDFYKKDLPIEPYVLGLLLGDGCFRCKGKITLSIWNEDVKETINNINLEEGLYIKHFEKKQYINFKGKSIENNKSLYSMIKDMNLHGLYSNEKFIPEEYKYSSVEDRIELIRGLLDADGYASKKGLIYFYTTSKKLCDDFREVMWSLGENTLVKEKMGSYKKNDVLIECKKVYSVHVYSHTPEIYFKLQRKIDRIQSYNLQKRNPNHNLRCRIDNIEYYGKDEAKCITLEDEDGLYMTDNFVVTHNSFVINSIKSGSIEPRIVNTDKFTEHFKAYGNVKWDEYEVKIKLLTKSQLINYLDSLLPLWIDGTSASAPSSQRRDGILKSLGYDTGMVWVNTSLETSLNRAAKRERPVPPKFIKEIYEKIESLKPYYKSNHKFFVEINNNEGELTDSVILSAFRETSRFFNEPVKNPIGQSHIKELKEKGLKYLTDLDDFDRGYLSRLASVWYTS